MKVVLLGMNNPVSADPRHALFPAPVNCTGWRIWQMIRDKLPDVTRRQYLDGFERVNLVNRVQYDVDEARRRASELPSLWRGRTVVVLGETVRRALGLPDVLIHPVHCRDVTWRQLPHPSGRNHWYNDPHCRDLAATLLAEMYEQGRGE